MPKYAQLFSQNIKGWQSDNNGQGTGHCPFHNDTHRSFSANAKTGLWICFACGLKGNARQFIQYLINNNVINKEKTMNTTTIKHNAEYVSVIDIIEPKRTDFNAKYEYVSCYLLDKMKDTYSYHKDIYKVSEMFPWNPFEVSELNIQFDGNRLIFKYFDERGNFSFTKYHKGKNGLSPFIKGRTKESVSFYPLMRLVEYDNSEPLFYAEGEPDVVTLLSQGYNAITHINGALSIPKDLTPISRFNEIIIIFDNDRTGLMASEKLALRLNEEFPTIQVKIVRWSRILPIGYDITNLFMEAK